MYLGLRPIIIFYLNENLYIESGAKLQMAISYIIYEHSKVIVIFIILILKPQLKCVVFRNPRKCSTEKYLIWCKNTYGKLSMNEQFGRTNLKYY